MYLQKSGLKLSHNRWQSIGVSKGCSNRFIRRMDIWVGNRDL